MKGVSRIRTIPIQTTCDRTPSTARSQVEGPRPTAGRAAGVMQGGGGRGAGDGAGTVLERCEGGFRRLGTIRENDDGRDDRRQLWLVMPGSVSEQKRKGGADTPPFRLASAEADCLLVLLLPPRSPTAQFPAATPRYRWIYPAYWWSPSPLRSCRAQHLSTTRQSHVSLVGCRRRSSCRRRRSPC